MRFEWSVIEGGVVFEWWEKWMECIENEEYEWDWWDVDYVCVLKEDGCNLLGIYRVMKE